jgi:hypothetical protein
MMNRSATIVSTYRKKRRSKHVAPQQAHPVILVTAIDAPLPSLRTTSLDGSSFVTDQQLAEYMGDDWVAGNQPNLYLAEAESIYSPEPQNLLNNPLFYDCSLPSSSSPISPFLQSTCGFFSVAAQAKTAAQEQADNDLADGFMIDTCPVLSAPAAR